MDLGEKHSLRPETRKGDQLNHQNSGISGDWQFSNPAMAMIPPNPSIAISQGIISSLCPPVSMVDSFTPNLWSHPSNPVNLGKALPQSPRLNVGWNSSDQISKLGMFLPPNSGILPPNLSHFPADPSFIERAARFSSFNVSSFSGMANPFAASESLSPYSNNASIGVAGGQTRKSDELVSAIPMPIDHASKCGSPVSQRENGVVGGEETPDLANVSGDSSSKGLNAKKRKKANQDLEVNQVQGSPQEPEEPETKPKVEQSSSAPGNAKLTGKNAKDSSDGTKEDYIHVRARRGQATNSHSLAERVRRERISERMKYLQDLVPGCSKVTGKAVMLDEIINYVQSLQRQVEFLSMKLAAVNPSVDVNIEGLLSKDLFQSRGSPSTMGFSPDFIHPQLLPSQQGLVPTGIPGIVNPSDAVRRAISAQLTAVNGFKEPMTQMLNPWDNELRNIVQMTFGTDDPPNTQQLINKPRDGFPI